MNRTTLFVAGLAILVCGIHTDAEGDSVVQFMTAKSLPDATVDVIDPESGSSSGTTGSDVNLAVGDVILFRFSVGSAPASAVDGIQAYLTEYVPPGTEVIGARMIDEFGNTVEPRRAGLALDGCSGGANCNSFSAVPCASGTCNFNTTPGTGSIAQVYADTGIFITTDPLLGPSPGAAFLTLDNGISMDAFEPRAISPEIVQLLNDTSSPYFAHNDWDWDQVQAYGGQSSSVSDGDGNTPFRYGSPVAGPDTYYRFEATDTGTRIQLDGVDGPWDRVKYPGSQIGSGTASNGSTSNMTRVGVDTGAGLDLTPLTPIDATAIRFAMGETRVGEIRYVEVALRVTQVPIDPTFGTAGGNVDCGEVFGSDISSKSANTGGANNPWPTHVGHAACVFLRLKLDLEVDKALASVGTTLVYTVSGKNLSVADETNTHLRLKFVDSDQDFVSATPPPNRSFTCPGETNKTCLEWDFGTLAPSDELSITANISVQGQGGGTNVVVAQYLSDQLTAIDPAGYSTTALTVVQPVASPQIQVDNALIETQDFAAAGSSDWLVTGTIVNAGTAAWTSESFQIVLPTGWSITGGQITIAGTNVPCSGGNCATSSSPTFFNSQSYSSLQSRTISFQVTVPGGAENGLYPIDISTRGSQNVFGSFETLFRKAVTVNVGAVRTTRPVVTCPIASTAPSISGTSEASAAIDLLFSLMSRGNATASGTGAWTITSYLATFGPLYGGLEVRATATAPGKLTSEPSDSCIVTAARQCSDGFDNDNDGVIDFPADPGCTSLTDNDETDPALPQCSDGVDNNSGGGIDWPADPSCADPTDDSEDGVASCNDGIDNDGDGLIDFPDDTDCTSAADGTEVHYAACQDGLDNDGDTLRDFPADPGCHSLFDDDEFDSGSSTLDTKARLLLAVDSSGSMNWNTCVDVFTGGDGTTECPGGDVACSACGNTTCGNTEPDDSRLYQVTSGLSNVVAAFGEVEYSLMRFHQRATPFSCPTAAASQQSGGWQGGGIAPCGGGFASGDLLVSFAQDNEATILTWMNHDSDYGGVAPIGTDWEIRGSGTTPLAGILGSANSYMDGVRDVDLKSECRPYRVVLVTDGAETCGGDPVTAAATLRTNQIPVHVIGFSTTDPTVNANLDAIANAGGTTEAILVDDEAALSAALADIIDDSILFETCNDADDDCDTLVDEDFPDLGDACDNGQQGECLRPGVMVCSANEQTTVCNAPPVTPGTETCNGLDDDCDGLVDEDLGTSCTCNPIPEICNGLDDDCDSTIDEGTLPGVDSECGTDIGACAPGTIQCVGGSLSCEDETGPAVEICNSIDDDCDTFIDEISQPCYEPATGCDLGTGDCEGICQIGVQTCDGTQLGECVGDLGPGAEVCNGVDDDCDGTADDGLGLGTACDNGLEGDCFATGVLVCDGNGGVVCTAPIIPPGIETCDGTDQDCDGEIDEPGDLGPPIGNTCGGGGACGVGVFECVDGEIVCVGNETGTAEVCNAADDDCDQTVDEDVPGTGVDCVEPGFEEYQDIGECEFGHLECIGGVMDCRDYQGPTAEIPCNGIDEDCDGADDQTCPGEQGCVENACRTPCEPGEFPCPFGFICEEITIGESYCMPDPCLDLDCPPGSFCDADQDPPACVEICDTINCPDGFDCRNGICQDCFTFGCGDGEICVRNPTTNAGECTSDLCAAVECEADEFCQGGECIPSTCTPSCAFNEVCQNGECIADPCGGECRYPDQVCNPETGSCQANMCMDVECPESEACNPINGDCIADPCLQTDCGAGFECIVLPDGSGTCYEPPREVIFAGGGGCQSGGGSSGGAGALLLLGLAATVSRLNKRRRRDTAR